MTANKFSSNTINQRVRLLEKLQSSAVTTVQARLELDVMHPSARVQELREAGHNIITYRETIDTGKGKHHKVAKYALLVGDFDG